MSILEDIHQHHEYSSIWIDRDMLMRSLGIDLTTREYIVLNDVTPNELGELLLKSLMWMETVNELTSTSKKLKLDKELERDKCYDDRLHTLILTDPTIKMTEAKAIASSHKEYINLSKELNLLTAYVEYLSRLLDNLDRYHYVIKSRVETLKSIERKY